MPLSPNISDRESDKFRGTTREDTCVAVCGDDGGAIDVGIVAGTPNIVNTSIPLAGTEVSQAITDNTKRLEIRSRNLNANLQFAFTAGQSGTNFITINAGSTLSIDGLDLVSATLYIQSDKAGNTVEILEFI